MLRPNAFSSLSLLRDLHPLHSHQFAWRTSISPPTGTDPGEAVLGAFWGGFEGALERGGELTREEVRAAVERVLEVWLFGRAGQTEKRSCPSCAEGRLKLRFGRFGPFVGCARCPDCGYTRPLARDPADDGAGPVALGADPETGLALTLRTGR